MFPGGRSLCTRYRAYSRSRVVFRFYASHLSGLGPHESDTELAAALRASARDRISADRSTALKAFKEGRSYHHGPSWRIAAKRPPAICRTRIRSAIAGAAVALSQARRSEEMDGRAGAAGGGGSSL